MNRRDVLATAIGVACLSGGIARAETLPFRRGSWASLLKSRAGRPTIVHFWGMTCGPCLVELPAWGRFHAGHPDIDLILISADPIPQRDEWVARTLAKAGLGDVESWSFQDGFAERLFWEVDPDWQGELPYTVLLDRAGAHTQSIGAADFAAIETWARTERIAPTPS